LIRAAEESRKGYEEGLLKNCVEEGGSHQGTRLEGGKMRCSRCRLGGVRSTWMEERAKKKKERKRKGYWTTKGKKTWSTSRRVLRGKRPSGRIFALYALLIRGLFRLSRERKSFSSFRQFMSRGVWIAMHGEIKLQSEKKGRSLLKKEALYFGEDLYYVF